MLLLERREHVEALVDAVPAAMRGPGHVAVLGVLEAWRPGGAPAAARIPAVAAIVPATASGAQALPTRRAELASSAISRAGAGPLAALTDRELEVLERVAAGASNKLVARDLDLSLHTVKRHVANILDKLDCASPGQAADLYRRHEGLLANG